MSLEFRRNGRKVSMDEFMAGLQQDAIDKAAGAVEDRLQAVRCPVHGTTPTAVRRGGTASDPTWQVEGCCDRLTEAVRAAF